MTMIMMKRSWHWKIHTNHCVKTPHGKGREERWLTSVLVISRFERMACFAISRRVGLSERTLAFNMDLVVSRSVPCKFCTFFLFVKRLHEG